MSALTPAQREIVTGLDVNFCVTSGAGCGKTRVLVERYVHFLEQDADLPLDRLAAITFTEMTAAEMRERIRQACRTQVDEARRRRDPARMRLWLDRYWGVDVAPIDTIHGFCAGLLRRYPIEAGVDPNFSLLDEAEAAFLREDVVAATVERLLGGDDPDLLRVLEHHDLGQARGMLAEVLGRKREVLHRVAGPVLGRSDEEVLRDLKAMLGERTSALLARTLEADDCREAAQVLGREAGPPTDRLEAVRREALDEMERLGRARTPDLARAAAQRLAGCIDLRVGSARAWGSKEAMAGVKEALGTIREAVKAALAALPAWDEALEREHLALARSLHRTAARVLEAYEAAKREASALDFEDLQIRARDLLRHAEHGRVLDECRRRFRAILVDELQDTDFLQFEIVNLLASAEGRGGRPPALRPGALFAVGDPKQSIYRFRGAEFEVFRAARERVEPAGRKGLVESWRLHAGAAALVNHVFAPRMGDLYEPIEGRRERRNDRVGEFLIVRSPDGDPLDAATGHAQEAAHLAARLREMVEQGAVTVRGDGSGAWRPAGYGDVAVLLRRTTHLHVYEEALEREGVPYYVVAGGGFYKQQEVLDVLNLLRVLDDPADDLHLAGVLRSPMFAVSDEGLYRLRGAAPSLHEALAEAAAVPGLDPEDRRGAARAAALLPRWAALKDRLGLAALVDETVFASGYAASAVGRFGGARAYANLRQMAELARRFERHGLHSLGDFIGYVTDFMRSEMRAEQAPVETPGGDTVRVMTIHKAKGLEFPVVVLPDLSYAPRASAARFLIHPSTGVAVRLGDDEEEGPRASAAVALARQDDAEAEGAEALRVLYVAVTRAKDYLIFASHLPYNRAAGRTMLDVLLEGLGTGADAVEDGVLRLPDGNAVGVRVVPPREDEARHGRRRAGPRDVLAAGRVQWPRLADRREAASAEAVAQALADAAPVEGPRPAAARVTATALAAYGRCPARYWWAEVAGLEDVGPADGASGRARREYGVLCHRALELAVSPDEGAVRRAVEGALGQGRVAPGADRDALAARLALAVRAFWASDVGRRVASARNIHREMPVLLRLGEAEVSGTMDLVFEGPGGRWEVVDYKASGPSAAAAGRAAEAYDLQMGLYALAAERWLGRPVAAATVYFLGSGVAVERPWGKDRAARVEREAGEALAGLAAGRFGAAAGGACERCRYTRVCEESPERKGQGTVRGDGSELRLLGDAGTAAQAESDDPHLEREVRRQLRRPVED